MRRLIITVLLLSVVMGVLEAQRRKKNVPAPKSTFDEEMFEGLKWRNLGPYRGGRSVAAAGVTGNDRVYYMGSTGGGLWKTEDAGITWKNISDGFFKTGSVGAIGICESDPNVIYVGMGEHAVRGVMTSHGDGVYKSTDAGRTWTHIGLKNSRHISDVIVHPVNPDIVYVAVQGAVHGRTQERGVYKTTDGGNTWNRVLYKGPLTGASGLSMDMSNPRILYASLWQHIRFPWKVESGGENSGIYKSIDEGRTWEKLEEGLPEKMGKSGISVSRANPDVVYAVIEADKGGVYRSDDGGEKWRQTTGNRVTIARAWYYMEIFADPVDSETVYVLNAPMLRSVDGGRSFVPVPTPHGDNHDLWINPGNNKVMINANDGGANVSFNAGKTWSTQRNQSTAQFYRVITDNQLPYHVYGGQQDNSAIGIASRTSGQAIGWKDWYSVAGGESAFIAFDPDNPAKVYGGSYQGNINVWDRKTGIRKDIMAYPVIGLGSVPGEMKYRFNWNSPIVTSPHDRSIMYHAGNVVLKTTNGGQSWVEISPDLTRDDKSKQGPGGGPFTNEAAGGENYNTIMSLVESQHEAGTIWVGTDDGYVQLTRNGGESWSNVTPPGLQESIINSIEVSPHDAGTAYIAVTRYKFNDFRPMIYRTGDYGVTWSMMINGIGNEDFVRVVREDPMVKGLLYAGTETGMYVSFDDGVTWARFQLNLPVSPVTDLTMRNNDLVAATSGRGFWVLDDLSAIQQSKGNVGSKLMVFKPYDSYKLGGGSPEKPIPNMGVNRKGGVLIDYYLPSELDSVVLTMEILDNNDSVIRRITNQKDKSHKPFPGGPPPPAVLPSEKGLNRFAWDMRRGTITHVEDVFVFGDYRGSRVAPGDFKLRLILETDTVEAGFRILGDPRIKATDAHYQEQEKLLVTIEETVADIHQSVNKMRSARKQLESYLNLLKDREGVEDLLDSAKSITKRINEWEQNLIQPKQKTFQDVINFPNQLNAELLNLRSRADSFDPRLTDAVKVRLDDLLGEWSGFEAEMDKIIQTDMKNFNEIFRKKDLPAILMEE